MNYSNKIEIIINQNNEYYFDLYTDNDNDFNFLFPSNEHLINYWDNVIGYYFYSSKYDEYVKYNNQVFRTYPTVLSHKISNKFHLLGDKLVFNFSDEESAFYFKLKFL